MREVSHHIMVRMTSKNVQRGANSFKEVICIAAGKNSAGESSLFRNGDTG